MRPINPTTEEPLDDVPDHTPADVESRLAAAGNAFRDWRRTSMDDRSRLMRRAAAVLRARSAKFSALMTREMGKPITGSEAEVEKCAAACDHFAEHAARYLATEEIPCDADRSYVRCDPLGAVLAIMPWNFPFWQVFRFAAPALMAGNVAVLKHAPNVPGCALAIEAIFREAGFPPGVFSTLLIDTDATANVIAHPVIRAVTLTGSERAGMAVASAAGARCINSGQSCIAAKRFIVERPVVQRFEKALAAKMAAMAVGDPLDRKTQVGPLARVDLLENLHDQVRRSLKAGARLVTGGRWEPGRGYFYQPTVLADVRPGNPAFEEETFGPVAAVVVADDERHAVELANRSRYGLGASIWTPDVRRAERLAGHVESGCVFVNGVVKSDPRLPFGGIKNSGYGRELAREGIREFVNVKTVWMKAAEQPTGSRRPE